MNGSYWEKISAILTTFKEKGVIAMGLPAIRLKSEDNIFTPSKRPGTKSFLDVPRELKEKDFQSESGQFFLNCLPSDVRKHFHRAIMETGIQSEDTLRWLEYATSVEDNGRPVSPIARWVCENPYNPRAFKYLYGEEDALSELDKGYIKTPGAHAIYLRLQSLIKKLPDIIRKERKRFKLKSDQKYVIYNIGAAYGLDTVYMMSENPDLQKLVRVVHIDPDTESLYCGRQYVERLGISDCFDFIPKKIEDAKMEKAHMLLFIGMFCPIPTRICILVLKSISKFLIENGIAIFSTVQEKMLMGGPILDFIMWSYGWKMYFKTDNEPSQIVSLAGLKHDKAMDWEDELGFNRMTVARKFKPSVLRHVGDAFKIAKTFLFM